MSANDEKLYDGYPTQELIARAHFAEIERKRREREEEMKRQILELEEIVLYQPNVSRIESVTPRAWIG